MAQVMDGDRSALRGIVERYHSALLGFFVQMVREPSLAEDLVQETFIRLLRQRSYSPNRPFRPWVFGVAANLARDSARRRARETTVEDAVLAVIPDTHQGPEDRAVAQDTTRLVAEALARLAPEYQLTLVLRLGNDLSVQEIANALEVPIGTVKSRLAVGTRKLRESLLGRGAEAQP